MESTQNLKKRLKSVANIGKITKAMELVAATKMRKSQEIALASRPYAFAALDLLANVTLMETELPELLKKRKIQKILYVLVASDKGLAGAFNSSLFRKFEYYIKQEKNSDIMQNIKMSEKFFVAVGEKVFQYLSKNFRTTDSSMVLKKFTQVGDFTTTDQVEPLANFLVEGYLKKDWDKVIVFSSHFKSALKQEPLIREILPINFESIKNTIKEIVPETGKFADLRENFVNLNLKSDLPAEALASPKPSAKRRSAQAGILNLKEYTIEPSPKIVLESLVKHLFFMQVYHLILEANASEHSARRMAMKTASDNASELGEELNLQYNKARQAGITNQIIEITAGSESLQ